MTVTLILLVFSYLFYSCHTIGLTVEVDPNWTRKTITVGYKDEINFRLTESSTCDWSTNAGHEELNNGNMYPESGTISVDEDMNVFCSFNELQTRSIEIQVISKDQREVKLSNTEIRVNQDEMLTITDITICNDYSFNGKRSTIGTSLLDPMYLVEGNLRIISVSMNHVGIHSCNGLNIGLIRLKEVISQKFTNDLEISIITELQSLIFETDNLELSYTWQVFLVVGSDETVTTDHSRLLKGNKLMIDTMDKRKNLKITYSGAENSISGIVKLKSVTPILIISPYTNMIIENVPFNIACHIEDLSSFAITDSELITTLFDYYLSSSKTYTLNTNLNTKCKRGKCILACIHKFKFQSTILVFETKKYYDFVSLVSVGSDLVYTAQYGQYIALKSKDDPSSPAKIFCDDSGSILAIDSEFEELKVVKLSTRSSILEVYSSLNNKMCSTYEDGDAHATLKVSPLIVEHPEHNGTASLSISSINEIFNVFLIFHRLLDHTLSVDFCKKTHHVPENGELRLFTDDFPGTLGIFNYEVIDELRGKDGELTDILNFHHQIEIVPYLKFDDSSNPIIVVQNEYVSMCPPFVSSDIFCELTDTSNSNSIPFDDLNMVSHSECWYFQVSLTEPFTLQCHSKKYSEQMFSQLFSVISFPYHIIHNISILDGNNEIQIHGKSFKIEEDTDVILDGVYIYPKKFSANQGCTISQSFYQTTLSSGLYHGEVITKLLFKLNDMVHARVLYLTHVAHITRKTIVRFINEVGIILSCTPISQAPESSIWWTKGSIQEMNLTNTDQNTYEVPASQNAISTRYCCNWMNSTHFGKDVFDVESIEALFTVDLEASSKFLLVGDELTVNCRVQFLSSSQYRGYVKVERDDPRICSRSNPETCLTSQINYSQSWTEDVTPSINFIVTSAEKYKFKCTVFHQVLTREYTLEISVGEKIELTLELSPSHTVLVSRDVSLRCTVNRDVSEPYELKLYGPKNQTIYSCSGRELIHDLRTVTQDNSGQYRCEMVIKNVDRRILAVNTLTIVTEKVEPLLKFDIIPITKIKPDEKFVLTCHVINIAIAETGTLQITNGNDDCKEHDRCTDIPYSSNSDRVNLDVSNANKLQDVNYKCIATTQSSTTDSSISISWFVDPYVEILLENSNSWKIDSSCIIKCCLMGDFTPTTEFNWEIQVPSRTDVSQTKIENCTTVEISSLSWDYYGQFSCHIQIDQISVSNNYKIVPIGVKVDVNVPMVPQNAKLAVGSTLNLNCKVINTEKVQIVWNVNSNIQNDCSKVVDNSDPFISTTTCKVKLTDMGVNSIKCIYTMSQASKEQELISYQFDVVTGPSILKFSRKKSELSSTNLSKNLICEASGFVTQILIFSVESDSSENMKLAEKNIRKEENTETYELIYEIPDADANKKKIFECQAISRSSIPFAEPIQVSYQVTIDPASSYLSVIILSTCIPIFAVSIGIAYLIYWMKNRRKKPESRVLY